MKKAFLFLCVAVFMSACASGAVPTGNDAERFSMHGQWESGLFFTDSLDGGMVVVGVSSRLVRRADEIEAAKNDAALKVAMFYGMRGTVKSFHRSGAGFFDFIAEASIDLEPAVSDHARFIERLTFDPDRDVLLFDGGTLVRFRYAARVAPVTFVGTLDADGRPGWIASRNLPSVDGYMVAVGFSQNQVWLRDTVMRSTRAAAAGLIRGDVTYTATETVVVNGQALTYIRSRSEGNLRNFRIVEFWIDPGTMSVYTLGIARLGE